MILVLACLVTAIDFIGTEAIGDFPQPSEIVQLCGRLDEWKLIKIIGFIAYCLVCTGTRLFRLLEQENQIRLAFGPFNATGFVAQ